jgi:hypothetical protein
MAMKMKPGQRVLVVQNPHDLRAEKIVGTVVSFRPGEGFGGSDIAEVHYKHPWTGEGYTMPFGLSCLGPADPSTLTSLAEHYEKMAARLREVAQAQEGEKQ